MTPNYRVQTRILKPASEVFNAIVKGQLLCQYFTDRTTGDMEEGALLRWHWHHYEPELPVRVDKIITNRKIELTLDSREWKKTIDDSYPVKVIFEIEPLDDEQCLLSISEVGWKTDEAGLKASHDNCGGWTHMSMCLKGWIEHGIDLR